MSERVLEFTTRLTREDVAGVIEALVEGLKDGRLKIHKSDEALELEVPRVIDLEVEAKVSDERAKFEIEVSWRTNRAENPDRPEDDSPAGAADSAFTEKAAPEDAKQRAGKDDAALEKKKSAVKKVAAKSGAGKSAKSSVKAAPRTTRATSRKTKATDAAL